MSNRQTVKPPANVRRYVRNLRCSDCDSETGEPQLHDGVWITPLMHDAHCPVLAGRVSPRSLLSAPLTAGNGAADD